jgi:hypothetical protein
MVFPCKQNIYRKCINNRVQNCFFFRNQKKNNMNAKFYLALLAVVCLIAVVSAQSSTNPIESLQGKASDVAASATNTSPAAATSTSGGLSLTSGYSQLLVLACAFVVCSLLA